MQPHDRVFPVIRELLGTLGTSFPQSHLQSQVTLPYLYSPRLTTVSLENCSPVKSKSAVIIPTLSYWQTERKYDKVDSEMVKNKAAQELAQRRHLSLTPERRSEIASIASRARWAKRLSTGEQKGTWR